MGQDKADKQEDRGYIITIQNRDNLQTRSTTHKKTKLYHKEAKLEIVIQRTEAEKKLTHYPFEFVVDSHLYKHRYSHATKIQYI